jgi:hypothetical protein
MVTPCTGKPMHRSERKYQPVYRQDPVMIEHPHRHRFHSRNEQEMPEPVQKDRYYERSAPMLL